MPFLNAEDARQEATSINVSPSYAAYRALEIAVREAILDAVLLGLFTTTLSVATATSADASFVKDKFAQLGYAIDDSTTPGSWTIIW